MTNKSNGLIGHWPLTDDTTDHSDIGHQTDAVDVELIAGDRPAAKFNGNTSVLTVPDHPSLHFGTGDVTIAGWIHTDRKTADVVGDIVGKFDTSTRTGLQLCIMTNSGVTSTSLPNSRSLQFGIDSAHIEPRWKDHGRPGNAVLIAALRVSKGKLYAATLETGADETGHVWRYEGGNEWTDLGTPLPCNSVHTLVEFNDTLYCGPTRYYCNGSALGETLNQVPGGKVHRLEPDGQWTNCGHPGHEDAVAESALTGEFPSGKADDVKDMTVFNGDMYCVSNHRRGVFKYEGGTDWKYIGPDERIMTLPIYRGKMYALINGGPVYRYEGGSDWVYCGQPEASTQTYSGVIHEGRFYVATWPEGAVYRYEGGEEWTPVNTRTGRVGYAREIMAMVNYNGKMYIGSLPMANVWRIDDGAYTFLETLDHASAPLRRVWSMAVFQGRLFAGTLPSGRVMSVEAGKMAAWDDIFPGGWHHIAAVKSEGSLRVLVDGTEVGQSSPFAAADFDLTNDSPLKIGFGAFEHFDGLMNDLRIYNRALTPEEITDIAQV